MNWDLAAPFLFRHTGSLNFCRGTGFTNSWLAAPLAQRITVVNSALVDSAPAQINGFLFNYGGGGCVRVLSPKQHGIYQACRATAWHLFIDGLKNFESVDLGL